MKVHTCRNFGTLECDVHSARLDTAMLFRLPLLLLTLVGHTERGLSYIVKKICAGCGGEVEAGWKLQKNLPGHIRPYNVI